MRNKNTLEQWRADGELISTSAGRLFVKSANRLFFKEQGRGDTLLLIHGFPTSSWDWHAVYQTLSEKFNVLLIDMLGYGFSDKPKDHTYTTASQVGLIQEVLKLKGVQQIHVMSYSYGVSVAQEMLKQQQSGAFDILIQSQCFMNGGLFPDSNHPRLAQRLILGKLGWLFARLLSKGSLEKNLKSIFGPDTQPSDELIDQYWQLLNVNQGRAIIPKLIQYLHERQMYMHEWEQALLSANCPIQLIIGDQDEISGIEVANEFRRKISSDNVNILEGIGHYPQLEAPEKTCELYLSFISSISRENEL